jgi:hypothetical protein
LNDNSRYFGTKSPVLVITNINNEDITQADIEFDYYFCVVKGLCGEDMSTKPMQIRLAPDIIVVFHPRSATVCEGTNVTLSVVISASEPNEPVIYQ